jgi:hypothetical protein
MKVVFLSQKLPILLTIAYSYEQIAFLWGATFRAPPNQIDVDHFCKAHYMPGRFTNDCNTGLACLENMGEQGGKCQAS